MTLILFESYLITSPILIDSKIIADVFPLWQSINTQLNAPDPKKHLCFYSQPIFLLLNIDIT